MSHFILNCSWNSPLALGQQITFPVLALSQKRLIFLGGSFNLVYLSFWSGSVYTDISKNSGDTTEEGMELWENRRWYIGVKTNFQPVWRNSLLLAVLCLLNDLIIALLLFLLILIYYVYAPLPLTVNLNVELKLGLEYFEGYSVLLFFFFFFFVQGIKLEM